ncbi:MAG: hypothetical protein J7J22_04485 [Candidatus Verstraetearchaeota archaeon]|nr:hypothetical protein [Candidatus Verstraetearchaeota archaeon]
MSLRSSKFLYEPDDTLLEAMPIHIGERRENQLETHLSTDFYTRILGVLTRFPESQHSR